MQEILKTIMVCIFNRNIHTFMAELIVKMPCQRDYVLHVGSGRGMGKTTKLILIPNEKKQ